MCGEKLVLRIVGGLCLGSPPHVRGKVGKHVLRVLLFLDHPRMCGEKTKKIP